MKKISNLHDLAAEKQRLQQRLTLLNREMNTDVEEIKERFKPITRIISFFTGQSQHSGNGTQANPKTSLLKMGASLGFDMLVGSKLKKAGWLARLIVPPLLRGISSTVINKVKKTA
ncbi:MAG TPA: hypothetical protein VK508_21970 [Cyclobacteriaceae bacterium]|nr:hypothetical protein [Cyclobacteriaceae bacterium]